MAFNQTMQLIPACPQPNFCGSEKEGGQRPRAHFHSFWDHFHYPPKYIIKTRFRPTNSVLKVVVYIYYFLKYKTWVRRLAEFQKQRILKHNEGPWRGIKNEFEMIESEVSNLKFTIKFSYDELSRHGNYQKNPKLVLHETLKCQEVQEAFRFFLNQLEYIKFHCDFNYQFIKPIVIEAE